MSTEGVEREDVEVKQEVQGSDTVNCDMLPSGSESGSDCDHCSTMETDMLPSGSECGAESDHGATVKYEMLPSGSESGSAEECTTTTTSTGNQTQ